jgi:asparagine synthase (glutamine-hydrolysing)
MGTEPVLTADDWVHRGNAHAAGTAFHDGDHLDTRGLLDLFAGRSTAEFAAVASDLNGLFAVVAERNDAVVVVSDRIGSRAVFYSTGDPPRVSDHFGELRSVAGGDPVPRDRELEFRMATYVSGDGTLDPSIRKAQPGTVLRVDAGGDVSSRQYYSFRDDPRPDRYGTDRYAEWTTALRRAFERVRTVADGRQVVMGLSGGHDSRLIVTMLDRLGFDDVVLFTYSNIQDADYDLRVARRVVGDVGFDHFEVELTRDGVLAGHRSDLWQEIVRRLGRSGMSHTHPVEVAIQEGLKSAEAVEDDALRLHGHQLFGAGSFVPRRLVGSDDSTGVGTVVDAVYEQHYARYGFDDPAVEAVKDRIERTLRAEDVRTGGPFEAVERWYWRERIPNFLTVRPLVRMAFDVWFPLMDAELLAFWNGVSRRERYDKRLYERWVDDLYHGTYGGRPTTSAELKRAEQMEHASGLERLFWTLRYSRLGEYVEASRLRPYVGVVTRGVRERNGATGPVEAYRSDPLLAFVDEERFEREYTGVEGFRYFLADEILRTLDVE